MTKWRLWDDSREERKRGLFGRISVKHTGRIGVKREDGRGIIASDRACLDDPSTALELLQMLVFEHNDEIEGKK